MPKVRKEEQGVERQQILREKDVEIFELKKEKKRVGVGADRLTSDNKRSTLIVKHRVAIGV